MLIIKCDTCKEEVAVNMYLSQPDVHIHSHYDGLGDRVSWSAHARGRAICPRCGAEIEKRFESEIYPSDVIELALRREVHI